MKNNNVINTYAAFSHDNLLRNNSSSGGIFSLLAQTVFNNNGVVYGVSFTEDCKNLEFIRATDEKSLIKLRGSKYFQARMGDTFLKVKKDLENGILVLFTGTGCQINGLKSYLKKEYSNLYCVDILCHGVPSPKLWNKYIEYLEEHNNGNLEYINFRCKTKSIKELDLQKEKATRKIILNNKAKDPFMQMFLKNYSLRPSCYECHAKNVKKSDITIGDFWGIEKIAPETNDGRGTSLVITRTEKGEYLFNKIKNQIKSKSVSYYDSVKENEVEYKSVIRPEQRSEFYNDMNLMQFNSLIKKYTNLKRASFSIRIKRNIKKFFKFISVSKPNNDYYILMIIQKKSFE